MSTTTTTHISAGATALIKDVEKAVHVLAITMRQQRIDLQEQECPRAPDGLKEWIAQHGSVARLGSRLARMRRVADDQEQALDESRALRTRIVAALDAPAAPAGRPDDYAALRAREQYSTDTAALRAALAALVAAIAEAETVASLHVKYIASCIPVMLLGDRQAKQARLDEIARIASQQIAEVVKSQDENADLERWAAGHGAVVALTPLREP